MRRRWTVEFLPRSGWVTTRKFWTWRGAELWATRMSEGYNSYSINFYENGRKP